MNTQNRPTRMGGDRSDSSDEHGEVTGNPPYSIPPYSFPICHSSSRDPYRSIFNRR